MVELLTILQELSGSPEANDGFKAAIQARMTDLGHSHTYLESVTEQLRALNEKHPIGASRPKSVLALRIARLLTRIETDKYKLWEQRELLKLAEQYRGGAVSASDEQNLREYWNDERQKAHEQVKSIFAELGQQITASGPKRSFDKLRANTDREFAAMED